MQQLIELDLEDGNVLDIAPHAISYVEEMKETSNPNFPNARCYIRYSVGPEDYQAWLSSSFSDVSRLTNMVAVPGWLRLTRTSGDRIAFLAGNVLSRKSNAEGTELAVMLTRDGTVGSFEVRESRDQVKDLMDRAAGSPPPGLIEIQPAE